MTYSASLSMLLNKYPFEKYEDRRPLSGVHGIFLIIGCKPRGNGKTECTLLDFGGAVDVGYAIEASIQVNNWHAAYGEALNIMVADVSLMECESILRELHQIQDSSID